MFKGQITDAVLTIILLLLPHCRLAMLGFVGMFATEAITGVNTLQAWDLQEVYFGIRSAAGM